jgi:hypothetical protein
VCNRGLGIAPLAVAVVLQASQAAIARLRSSPKTGPLFRLSNATQPPGDHTEVVITMPDGVILK